MALSKLSSARARCRFLACISLSFLNSLSLAHAEFAMAPGPTGPVKDWELFVDPNFSTGFMGFGNCRNDADKDCYAKPKKRIPNPRFPENAKIDGVWDLFELGSKTTVRDQPGAIEGDKVYWANDNKNITLSSDGTVSMATNGMSEYDGKYLPDWNDRKWVHFAVAQTVAAPGVYGRPSGSLADMTKLDFSIDTRLVYHEANHKSGYDRNRHAVAFGLSFTIQNLAKNHPNFGQYIWLQAIFYDDREPKPHGGDGMDEGTGSLMVPIHYSEFGVDTMQSGQWVHLKKDILPYARRGIQKAAEKGILKSDNLSDYFIGSAVVGYELWGLDITTVEMKNLSLKVDASTLYPANGLYVDLNSLTKDNSAGKTPPPAADKPEPKPSAQPAGFFRMNGTAGVYYSNGKDAFCAYTDPEHFWGSGGAKDFSNVVNRTGELPDMANHGVCGPAPAKSSPTTPFVQMYNPSTGKHVWAAESSDVAPAGDNPGYIRTNVLGQVFVNRNEPGTVPLTMFFRASSTDYFFAPNASEADEATFKSMGYKKQGVVGYVYTQGGAGRKPIYSLFSQSENRHFYTDEEGGYYKVLAEDGWSQEGVRFYLKE